MSGISFNNTLISKIDVDFFRQGSWCADCLFSNDPKVGTKSALIIDDVQWIGTVISSTVVGPGIFKARIVGGNGKLPELIEASNLIDTTGIQILNKIIGSREILKPPAFNITTFQIKNWQLLSDVPMGMQLARFVEQFPGHVFRINKLGLIEIVDDESSAIETTLPTNIVLSNVLFDGSKIYSVSKLDKMIEVGSITSEGWMVERVSLSADFKSIQLTIFKDSIAKANDVVSNQTSKTSYNSCYACKIDSQNADGTFKLLPDDPRIKGSGMNNVPYRLAPGMTAKVPVGSRCYIQFDSEDPSKAFIAGFENITMSPYNEAGSSDFYLIVGNPSTAQYVALSNLTDTRISALETKLNSLITKYSTHVHATVTSLGTPTVGTAPETALTPGSSTACVRLKTE